MSPEKDLSDWEKELEERLEDLKNVSSPVARPASLDSGMLRTSRCEGKITSPGSAKSTSVIITKLNAAVADGEQASLSRW